MYIGIFGGTFDPPHIGHLILAAEAQVQLDLEKVLWVLTPSPPHKRGQAITPLQHRLDMVLAAIHDNPLFELSRVDIDRPAPHYSVDTVRLIREIYPGKGVIYLMGGDSLRDLPTWHQPRQFLEACHALGVMPRPGETIDLRDLEKALPGISQKVRFIETPLLDIASSEIRQRVAAGGHFRYFLPPEVYKIIQERGLYREPS